MSSDGYELLIAANDLRRLRLEVAAALGGARLRVTVSTADAAAKAFGPSSAVPPRLPALRLPGGPAAGLLSGAEAVLRRLAASGAAVTREADAAAADVWSEWASRELDPVLAALPDADPTPELRAALQRLQPTNERTNR